MFVAPEGDHYRTRLTHTLEVTGISRTVARALRLNEDLTEAIGLGHDVGHPPFGHIGEDVLDRCGRERFGRGFRHNEHSLRVVAVLEGLNLTEPVRDGILRHSSGAGEPATLEGKIVRLVDRIAYINHDIDDALRAGVLARRGPAGGGDRDARADGRGSGSTRWCTTWSSTPSAPGTSCRATTVGRAMLSLRSFMFERVYLGPRARAEHTKIERVLQRAVRLVLRAPGGAAGRRVRRDGGRARDRLSRRHDRPLRHPRLDRALRPAGPRALMARYTPESRERVRDAVDFAEIVGARTELKRAGVRRLQGLCPFHDERTPSFGIDPVEKLYHCFGCGAGGDVFKFVMETEGLDFGEALESLAERYRVPLERETEDPRDAARARAARAAAGAARAHGGVVRARAVGERRGGARARVPDVARAGGGRAAGVPRRLGAGRVGPGAQRLAPRRLHGGGAAGGRAGPARRAAAPG